MLMKLWMMYVFITGIYWMSLNECEVRKTAELDNSFNHISINMKS